MPILQWHLVGGEHIECLFSNRLVFGLSKRRQGRDLGGRGGWVEPDVLDGGVLCLATVFDSL